jgi:Ca2+-binding EF-hand superfamily protein
VKAMFQIFDESKDNKLSFDEFFNFVTIFIKSKNNPETVSKKDL